MQYDYNQLLTTARKRLSTINRSNASEQFYSDRSRVIYNSSFRRLQQKAQVFSLEPNASVRTRLTHSLEVSDLGRTLANKIAQELCSKGLLSAEIFPLLLLWSKTPVFFTISVIHRLVISGKVQFEIGHKNVR